MPTHALQSPIESITCFPIYRASQIQIFRIYFQNKILNNQIFCIYINLMVTNYGEGGYKMGGGEHVKFYRKTF